VRERWLEVEVHRVLVAALLLLTVVAVSIVLKEADLLDQVRKETEEDPNLRGRQASGQIDLKVRVSEG
jgi:uncharacterized membrane protein YqhA